MVEKTMLDTLLSKLSLNEKCELDAMDEQYVISGTHSNSCDGEIPRVKGFVRSSFSPLIYESIIKACEMAKVTTALPLPHKKGIIAGSMFTDAVTEQETWQDMLKGKRLSPIMFPQSVPSAVIGYTASVLNINGPMTCTGMNHPLYAFYMLRQAWDWLREGDAEVVVITFCDVDSLRCEDWLKEQRNLQNDKYAFYGRGAVCMVMETASGAASRQVEKTFGIKETLAYIFSNSQINGCHSRDEAAAAKITE